MTQPLPPTTIVTWLDTGRSLQGSGSGTLHGDLGVEGTLYVGNQGARIASSGSGSIIVGSSTQYAMVSGVGASHLAAN
ncbi:MAG: hypothetical protein J2P17_35165, partial [Mycobacterium sp.]|nr:hypothetical protein [Mycobacterium sp.]